jgi:ABC-2 type transport system permease protein
MGLAGAASQEAILEAAGIVIPEIPPVLIVCFLVYFLGGYLLYASIFASIGSAVEQESDAQQLMLPVSFLIIVPIIFINVVAASPDSTLSVVLSMIPFFSPILMVVRVAITTVPLWQVLLSLLLLVTSFAAAVWVGSRIYRVGILMYGKRPTFKELARWIRYA